MSQFVYNIILSDVFLILVLIISFGFISQQALRNQLYKSYALGWLLGILIIISIGALMGRTPDEVNQEIVDDAVSLNFFQVLLSVFLGLIVSGAGMGASMLWRDNSLRHAMQTVGYTALFVTLLFLMFIASTGIRYMMGIFALTLVIMLMFGSIIRDNVGRISARRSSQNEDDVQELQRARNRVEAIREDMRRE